METSWMVNDYPEDPRSDDEETNITIYVKIETADFFPKEWDEDHKIDYVRGNIRDYLSDSFSDIEVDEIRVS